MVSLEGGEPTSSLAASFCIIPTSHPIHPATIAFPYTLQVLYTHPSHPVPSHLLLTADIVCGSHHTVYLFRGRERPVFILHAI